MTPVQPTLTPAQIEQLREELQRTLTRLERSMAAKGNGRPGEIDQSAVGRLSRIEALQNAGLTQNLHERERAQLEAVVDALRRLEAGSYGLCTVCQATVQFERLLVFPETRTCAHCGSGG
jgi:DnaK suppressor protein